MNTKEPFLLVIGGVDDPFFKQCFYSIAGTVSSSQTAFFNWWQRSEIVYFIKKNNLENIVIVGHSLGGKTAVEVATEVKNKVILLVTLDPVGIPKQELPNFTPWINVIAMGENTHISNIIAKIGYKWGESKNAKNIIARCNHNNIPKMLLTRDEENLTVWDMILGKLIQHSN